MSYCRFENTYRDLRDCLSAIADDEKLSKSEAEFAGRLVEICREITDHFEEMTEKEIVSSFLETP